MKPLTMIIKKLIYELKNKKRKKNSKILENRCSLSTILEKNSMKDVLESSMPRFDSLIFELTFLIDLSKEFL